MVSILVADDEKTVCWAAERALTPEGYKVQTAGNGLEALAIIESGGIDVVVLDLRMPGMNGLDVLRRARKISPSTIIVIISAYGDMATTIEAMKLGAYDFIAKPFNVEKLKEVIARAVETHRLYNSAPAESSTPEDWRAMKPSAISNASVDIIGKSPGMQDIYKLIGRISQSDVTVLICGDSGSGKELIARAIHESSRRCSRPFLAVNCTAIPASLIESEFFGHEKGSFTGAHTKKIGKFELADRGTLFLDEIGDMSLDIQSRMLRVLQEKEFVRVGGTREIRVDVRVIAATNMNLEKAISENRFREDLYHRLKVISINIPPLRERTEDILPLSEYFLRTFAARSGGLPKTLSPETIEILLRYNWPGNVRELKNAIESATAICQDPVITLDFLPPELHAGVSITGAKDRAAPNSFQAALSRHIAAEIERGGDDIHQRVMEAVEAELICQAMEHCKGNQSMAARLLGISRNTLRLKLDR